MPTTPPGQVQDKVHRQPAQAGPLGHRLELVYRLGGLDLDHALQFLASTRGCQDKIGKLRVRADPDGHRLLGPGIDRDGEFPLVTRLKQADHPVVLELFADGP